MWLGWNWCDEWRVGSKNRRGEINSIMFFFLVKKPGPPDPPKLEPVEVKFALMEQERKSTGDK